MLSIGDSGLKHLLDERGTLFRAEGQDIQCLADGLAADQVCNQTAFLCRQACIIKLCRNSHRITLFLLGLLVSRVAFEGTSQREFTELVANHVFGNIHRNVRTTVVNRNGQTDEVRQNRRTARPSLDWTLVARCTYRIYFFQQVQVNERAFFKRTCHSSITLYSRSDDVQSCCQCACYDVYGSP
ncbi:hypothetical protein D3C78_1137070 [compost metagenome]